MEIHSGRVKSVSKAVKGIIIFTLTLLIFLVSINISYSQSANDIVIVNQPSDQECFSKLKISSCISFIFKDKDMGENLYNYLLDFDGKQIKIEKKDGNYIFYYGCIQGSWYPCASIFGDYADFYGKYEDKYNYEKYFSEDMLSNFYKIRRILEELYVRVPKWLKEENGKITKEIWLKNGKPISGQIEFPYFGDIIEDIVEYMGSSYRVKIADVRKIGDFIYSKKQVPRGPIDLDEIEKLVINNVLVNFSEDVIKIIAPNNPKKISLIGFKDKDKYLVVLPLFREDENTKFILTYKETFPFKAKIKKDLNHDNVIALTIIFNQSKFLEYSGEVDEFYKSFMWPSPTIFINCGEDIFLDELEPLVPVFYKVRRLNTRGAEYIDSLKSCNLEIEDICKIKGEFEFIFSPRYGLSYVGVLLNDTLDICNKEIITKNNQTIKLEDISYKEFYKKYKKKDRVKISALRSEGKLYININPGNISEIPVTTKEKSFKEEKVGNNSIRIKGDHGELYIPRTLDDAKNMIKGIIKKLKEKLEEIF